MNIAVFHVRCCTARPLAWEAAQRAIRRAATTVELIKQELDSGEPDDVLELPRAIRLARLVTTAGGDRGVRKWCTVLEWMPSPGSISPAGGALDLTPVFASCSPSGRRYCRKSPARPFTREVHARTLFLSIARFRWRS